MTNEDRRISRIEDIREKRNHVVVLQKVHKILNLNIDQKYKKSLIDLLG